MDLLLRPRRLRTSPYIRNILRETTLTTHDFMLPLFIKSGLNIKKNIQSLPGHYQLSIDNLDRELEEIANLGIKGVILFGIPEHKDAIGSKSFAEDGIIQKAVKHIKKQLPDLLVATDICLCEYTDHGHCGVVVNNDVDNDQTLELLRKQAVSHAKAGADIVAPSCMMDGMVLAIRSALDQENYKNIIIMSYSVKYSSSMYGPFRAAAEGAPKFGNRKTYQMDFGNANEAIKEAKIDVTEGADILMVKPAHTYLDIIAKIKNRFPEIPLAAYHTSGEFAMIKAAARNGWLDEIEAVLEVTTAIKRAGANLIISYFTKDLMQILKNI